MGALYKDETPAMTGVSAVSNDQKHDQGMAPHEIGIT